MDKKDLAIIILVTIIVGLLVWIFGVAGADYRELGNRLDGSIITAASITQSARILQAGNKESLRELEEERIISRGFQETSDNFERLYNQSERNNREQREIIERITSGDIEIDRTIDRIELRLIRSQKNINRLRESQLEEGYTD